MLFCLASLSCARRFSEKIQLDRHTPASQPVNAFARLLAQNMPSAGWQLTGQDGHFASNVDRRKQGRRHSDTMMYKVDKLSSELMSAAADMSIEEEDLSLPFLPFPGWKDKARKEAVLTWVEQRKKLLAEEPCHLLFGAVRDAAEEGTFMRGVDNTLLGMAEVGLVPPPPEKVKAGSPEATPVIQKQKEEEWSSLMEFFTSKTTEAPKGQGEKPKVKMFPYLLNIKVKEGARRRGIAKDIIQMAEQQVVEAGYNRMYLKVDRGNIPARKLYDRLGYKLIYAKNKLDPSGRVEGGIDLFLRKDLPTGE